MKRKDLYNYVRTEIINELSTNENIAVELTGTTGKTVQSFKDKAAADKFKAENPNIKAVKPLEEDRGSNFKAGPNFANIKRIYAGSVIERILNTIEEAGDIGIKPKDMQAALGIKHSSELNPIKKELLELGAIVGPAPKEKAEPEEITPEDDLVNLGIPKVTDNPEDKEVDDDELVAADDEYYKPEEEEDSTEDEIKIDPKTADKEVEKTFGSQSLNKKTLSSEEQAMYDKFKTSVDKHIATIGNKKSTPEQIKIARQFLEKYKNNKDLVSLFRSQGNKDLK